MQISNFNDKFDDSIQSKSVEGETIRFGFFV